MECIIAALEFPLTTYPRHTARRRTHHAMLCRISSDSALLQFSTLTMTNAASASMPLCPASGPLWPVCVVGSKEQAGDGTVWTPGASCCSLATVSTFPQFLTERGRDGSPLVLHTIHRLWQSFFTITDHTWIRHYDNQTVCPLWLLHQQANLTSTYLPLGQCLFSIVS